jgi:hypothetical protein
MAVLLLPPLLAVAAGCAEPGVALEVPDRAPGQRVLDPAGILDDAVAARLDTAADKAEVDVVALAFTDEAASLGQADRGGRRLLEAWDADVVLVAVARPGDFASRDDDRRRFFGVFSADRFAVPRGLREDILEEVVPSLAARNRWPAAFIAAADALATGLAGGGG